MATAYKLKDLTSVDLKNGQKAEYEVERIEGGEVLLVKAQDGLHAMSPNCTHYGAPLVHLSLSAE
jgi:nitrite reductase/ring-hydroxylating ferredoxin subunit